MIKEIQIQVLPEESKKDDLLKKVVSKKINVNLSDINHIEILKRSVDARQRTIKINLRIAVFIKEDFKKTKEDFPKYMYVSKKEEVIIIGAGPAGLFAALKLLEKGKKPIVLERGKEVQERRKDLAILTKE
ncbi:MAG: FAD-binding protein, partial [Flavobacteriales bacterium]|nr:FAD-binding protein [Flavobacteriales bacterium]